jgi:signal transduction histidine kinase/sensor domain CHASE-containing protein/ActR/RegA family two-component response regulator
MGLRKKTVLVISIAGLILIALLTAAAKIVVMGGFEELERQQVRIDQQRAAGQIDSVLSTIAAMVGDWAPWDDSYEFMESRSEAFIRTNLPASVLVNLRVNFILYVDNSRQVIQSKFVTWPSPDDAAPAPDQVTRAVLALPHLVQPKSDLDRGILMVQGTPILLAFQPILRSDFSGPSRGLLVMGRYMDEEEVARISEISHLSLNVYAWDRLDTLPELSGLTTQLSTAHPMQITPVSRDIIHGYSLHMDLTGSPAYILQLESPRQIVRQGRLTLTYHVVALLASVGIFITLVLFFLEKMVLKPVRTLSRGVREIGRHGDFSERLPAGGKIEELETLADRINRMLAQIEAQSAAQEKELTIRKITEAALRESEDRHRILFHQVDESRKTMLTILDSIEANIYVADFKSYKILFMNRRIKEVFGADLEGKICYEVFRHETRPCAHCTNSRLVDPDGCPTGVLVWEGKNPLTQQWYMNYDQAIRWIDGSLVFFQVAMDISQMKRLEEDRIKAENQLRKTQKMETIGLLAGGVAHDLNNILAGIVSLPDFLLLQLPPDNPMRKPLTTMMETGQRAAAIVQDLLTLARRGVTVRESLHLNTVIEAYLASPENTKILSFHPSVALEVSLHESLRNMTGSPVHIAKTIMNLVSNAAEAMPQGGKIRLATANRHVDKAMAQIHNVTPGDYVSLTVADSGIGIAPEDQERIFEPFYTKKIMGRSGTGLGMAVVWGTVKDHDGFIDLQSTSGNGTTFTLYFPATRDALPEQTVWSIDLFRGHGEKILVVDDIAEQREIASMMLTELRYHVDTVPDGAAAIAFTAERRVDLLLLDMIMTGELDGLDTYRAILTRHPGQKAILVSGFSETERVQAARELGAGQYLRKPYTLEKLATAVRKELDRPIRV